MSKKKSARFKSTMPMIKIDKKAPSFNEQKCAFCGWQRQHHLSEGNCYDYSDENEDHFYKDRFFKPI